MNTHSITMDFYVDSPCKGDMELIQKLEFPGHLRDWDLWSNRIDYSKLGCFGKSWLGWVNMYFNHF